MSSFEQLIPHTNILSDVNFSGMILKEYKKHDREETNAKSFKY